MNSDARFQFHNSRVFSREIHLAAVLAPNCQQSHSTMKTLILLIPAGVMAALTSCTTVDTPPPTTATTTTHEPTTVARPTTARHRTTTHTRGGYYSLGFAA